MAHLNHQPVKKNLTDPKVALFVFVSNYGEIHETYRERDHSNIKQSQKILGQKLVQTRPRNPTFRRRKVRK